jgi:hypothetical protein
MPVAIAVTKFVNYYCHRNLRDDDYRLLFHLFEAVLESKDSFTKRWVLDHLGQLAVDYSSAPLDTQKRMANLDDIRVTIPAKGKNAR